MKFVEKLTRLRITVKTLQTQALIMLIFITGFMGSGKSHFFDKWSQGFKGDCFDFDAEIATRLEIEPSHLGAWIEENSWEAFRAKERSLLEETLRSKGGLFSLGGGTLHYNTDLLSQIDERGSRVWVSTPIELCWQRVRGDKNRPLVKAGKDEFLRLYHERLELYVSANISISGENDPPDFTKFCNKYRDLLKID